MLERVLLRKAVGVVIVAQRILSVLEVVHHPTGVSPGLNM